MSKLEDAASANAIIRRDAPGKIGPGQDCPKCHKTTLSVSPDEHNVAQHTPKCPACGFTGVK